MDKKKGRLSPSMMCAKIDKLTEYIQIFEEAKIEYLHIDIMDGTFVPNLTLGVDYVKQLRRLTDIPLDFHLMVKDPEEKIPWFDFKEGELVAFHTESTDHPEKCIELIRQSGAKASVALSPKTPVFDIARYLESLDGVLLLMVSPGFAGQDIVKSAMNKVKELKALLKEKGIRDLLIEVDGNMTFDNAEFFYNEGADIFVAGTSSIFKNGDMPSLIAEKRKRIGW